MIYVQLLESMSLIALAAYVYSQTHIFGDLLGDNPKASNKIVIVIFFGILGIVGNYTGVNVEPYAINSINSSVGMKSGYYIGVHDAIANTRPIAAIVAGYIGGPFLGAAVGAISGINRYFLGGFTALSCAVATICEGLIGAFTRKLSKDIEFNVKHIFIGTIAAEVLQMAIILIISKPFYVAVRLVNTIALPMIIINSSGTAIFVNIIKNARESYNKISAIHAQKALSIAQKTVSYMRRGLSLETARNVSKIIYEMSDIEGVFIGNKKEILSYSGIKLDNNVLKKQIEDYYKNPKYKIIELTCKNRNIFFVLTPFIISNSGFEGMLGLGVKSKKRLNVYFKQFAEELNGLLCNQIELCKLNKMAQEASVAKFKALRAQIEPHFLFNALNTIASLCRTDPLKARGLIVDLSNYFRQTLKKQENFLPLRDEIEFIKSYLSIEQARFGERLKLVIDIPESLMNIEVPVFVIQPVIENAIKHGIQPKAEGGSVFLKASVYEDDNKKNRILFSIKDTGIGMNYQKLKDIIDNSHGIGLKNVNDRLKLLYGEDCKINIKTSLNKGTKISFIIPVKEACILNE